MHCSGIQIHHSTTNNDNNELVNVVMILYRTNDIQVKDAPNQSVELQIRVALFVNTQYATNN